MRTSASRATSSSRKSTRKSARSKSRNLPTVEPATPDLGSLSHAAMMALQQAEALRRAALPPQPLKLLAAKAGDHPAIHFFLQSIFHAPSANEFHQQQEEPGYEPRNRIIVRDGSQVVRHIRVVRHDLRLGHQAVPAAKVCDLAVDPAVRGQGVATALLRAAEQHARGMGIAVLLARSDRFRLFARQGWSGCGRHSYSYAGPRAILAEIERRRQTRVGAEADLIGQGLAALPLTVRRWRHVEQNAPPRLFQQQFTGLCGVGERTIDAWRWLIARGAYDFFYVCIEGRDRMELDNEQASLVGYAFVKQGRVVELARAPGRDDVAAALLKRACGDAIEEEEVEVRLDAPPSEPMHQWVAAAGGTVVHAECDGQQRHLAKILALGRVIESSPPVAPDAPAVGFSIRDDLDPGRAEIGVVEFSGGRPRWVAGRGTSSLVKCRRSTFTQLALGHLTIDRALSEGLVEFTQPAGEKLARRLFPDRVWWSPPLPDLLG